MLPKENATMWIFLLTAVLTTFMACARTREPASDAQKLAKIETFYTKYKRSFPKVKDITAAELGARLVDDDLVIVDVRTPAEREVSMIPGAITSETFEAHPEDYRGETVVTYCTAGYRSGLYADKLRKDDWKVLNLKGSLLSWSHAGMPLVHDGEPTHRIHTFGPDWDLLAHDYQAVFWDLLAHDYQAVW